MRRIRMIDVVVYIGVVSVLCAVGHLGLGAGRDRKKLKADVISLRAGFRDRPDRIFRKHRVALDGLVQVALKVCDGHPRRLATAAFLALIGDASVVRLVAALERGMW